MKTKIEIKMNGANDATLTFPQFNTSCKIHSGSHINSIGNWARYLPHGNTKKVVIREFTGNVYIANMINMPEQAPDKYRLEVSSNGGVRGYITTGEMNITKEMFETLTTGLTRIHSKANRMQYMIA